MLNLALSSVGGQKSKRAEWAEVVKRGFLGEATLRMGLEGCKGWIDETVGR